MSEGVEVGDGGTSLGPQRLRPVQHFRNPPLLRQIYKAPILLCVKGDLTLLNLPAAAIVGARSASALGLKFTRQVAAVLAAAGYLIVSGLARGIDTAAHQAALPHAPRPSSPAGLTASIRRRMPRSTPPSASVAC